MRKQESLLPLMLSVLKQTALFLYFHHIHLCVYLDCNCSETETVTALIIVNNQPL